MSKARAKYRPGGETRELIITTAERLFAENGVAAVSNRQVSEAGGQANNSVVGYHFGTKGDLVRAIVQRHAPSIQKRRAELLAAVRGSTNLGDWLGCLVRPITEHIASLGSPSWYARFVAQASTDPVYHPLIIEETVASPDMQEVVANLSRLMPVLPAEVTAERGQMSRILLLYTCAERERALQEGTPTPRASWEDVARGLVDALAGLWRAPYTPAK